jgi:hypothetical protein
MPIAICPAFLNEAPMTQAMGETTLIFAESGVVYRRRCRDWRAIQ